MRKLILTLLVVMFAAPTYAENANVLPEGRFRARVKPMFISDMRNKFANSGEEENLIAKFEKELDVATAAKLNPMLAAIMQGAAGQPPISTLGLYDPYLIADTTIFGTALEYGLTKNITVGVIVPIISAETKFDLYFSKNAAAQSHAHPAVSQTDFAQAAKDSATSKGYNIVDDWRAFGLGDIELGVKHRLLNNSQWTFAYKTGLRLPTGQTDDPDILTDLAFGDGQMDWGTTLLLDYKAIPSTLLNVMAKYTVQFQDHQTMRIPSEDELFTTNKETIWRDLGDTLDLAVYSQYNVTSLFNFNATYSYMAKQKDNYNSAMGFYTEGLESNTNQTKHMADVGMGFSTIPWVRKGTFKVPMDAALNLTLPVAGRNVAKASRINLEYKLYF